MTLRFHHCLDNIRLFSIVSYLGKSHHDYYEILKLKNTCSSKEIRDAYLKLSKKHHPDKNQNTKVANDYFIQINEAYDVLSKVHTRSAYDDHIKSSNQQFYHHYDNVYSTKKYDPRPEYEDRYYGVKGVKKVNNWIIFMICVLFSTIGGVLQLSAIMYSNRYKSEKINEDNAKNQTVLNYSRNQANIFSKEEQIQKFKEGTLGQDYRFKTSVKD